MLPPLSWMPWFIDGYAVLVAAGIVAAVLGMWSCRPRRGGSAPPAAPVVEQPPAQPVAVPEPQDAVPGYDNPIPRYRGRL